MKISHKKKSTPTFERRDKIVTGYDCTTNLPKMQCSKTINNCSSSCEQNKPSFNLYNSNGQRQIQETSFLVKTVTL